MERAKAKWRRRLFRHLQYYGAAVAVRLPIALQLTTAVFARLPEVLQFTSVVLYWFPVCCNYPSAVLYRIPEVL